MTLVNIGARACAPASVAHVRMCKCANGSFVHMQYVHTALLIHANPTSPRPASSELAAWYPPHTYLFKFTLSREHHNILLGRLQCAIIGPWVPTHMHHLVLLCVCPYVRACVCTFRIATLTTSFLCWETAFDVLTLMTLVYFTQT